MKRIPTFVLALCMLLSTVALADDREPLRQAGVMIDASYWRSKGINFVEWNNYDIWADSITIMQNNNPPDMMGLSTYGEDFVALKNTGLLADLSGSKIIRESTARLRPTLKELVTTEDGKILGVPVYGWPIPIYWRQDAFDAAGLTGADVPQSYTELLDFMEKWIERVKAKPEKNICVAYSFPGTSPEKYDYVYWLLALLIESWETQAYYAGTPLNFDTPEFIVLLKRTREVGIQLYTVEPRHKKRKDMLQLFDTYRFSPFNDGRDYGNSHTVPYRITRDQPMLMNNMAQIFVIREGSEWTAECMTALEGRLSEDSGCWFQTEMYADIGPKEYHDGKSIYTATAGFIKDLDTYEGINVFPVTRTLSMYEGMVRKFRLGEVSAEKFAAEISKPKRDPNK